MKWILNSNKTEREKWKKNNFACDLRIVFLQAFFRRLNRPTLWLTHLLLFFIVLRNLKRNKKRMNRKRDRKRQSWWDKAALFWAAWVQCGNCLPVIKLLYLSWLDKDNWTRKEDEEAGRIKRRNNRMAWCEHKTSTRILTWRHNFKVNVK